MSAEKAYVLGSSYTWNLIEQEPGFMVKRQREGGNKSQVKKKSIIIMIITPLSSLTNSTMFKDLSQTVH